MTPLALKQLHTPGERPFGLMPGNQILEGTGPTDVGVTMMDQELFCGSY